MIRVVDLEKSIKFYEEGLGFKVQSRNDYSEGKFTLVFLRAENDSEDGPLIELTHNWETNRDNRGDAYGHVAYKVNSIADVQKKLRNHGYDLSWGPGKT